MKPSELLYKMYEKTELDTNAPTLNFWYNLSLFGDVPHTARNRRDYTHENLLAAVQVRVLRALEFTIPQIRVFMLRDEYGNRNEKSLILLQERIKAYENLVLPLCKKLLKE